MVLLVLCLAATQIIMMAVKRRESGGSETVRVSAITEVNKVG